MKEDGLRHRDVMHGDDWRREKCAHAQDGGP